MMFLFVKTSASMSETAGVRGSKAGKEEADNYFVRGELSQWKAHK